MEGGGIFCVDRIGEKYNFRNWTNISVKREISFTDA
jgi:hypothetical protein